MLFAQLSLAAKIFEGSLELLCECFEHDLRRPLAILPTAELPILGNGLARGQIPRREQLCIRGVNPAHHLPALVAGVGISGSSESDLIYFKYVRTISIRSSAASSDDLELRGI
jgi:hypothetical protein